MKKPISLLLFTIGIGLILLSCNHQKNNINNTDDYPIYDQPNISSTPFPLLTGTSTPSPSNTYIPTIPTITATFDSSRIITVTPATPAICPSEDPMVTPWFPICNEHECGGSSLDDVITYLNMGGTYKYLNKNAFRLHYDLTGDGNKEYAVRDINGNYIVGCQNGKYEIYTEFQPIQNIPNLEFVDDLNHNGIPEIYLSYVERHAFSSIHILEWDGEHFTELIDRDGFQFIGGTACEISYRDANQDGLLDIIAIDNLPLDPFDKIGDFPARKNTQILGWNGQNYVLIDFYFDVPYYRFQAVQDAEYAISMGKIDRAITLYQQVINDPYLNWWSHEKFKILYEQNRNNVLKSLEKYSSKPTLTPFPSNPQIERNVLEYDQLSAFAYFRLMVIYTVRDDEQKALQQLNVLQNNYGKESSGFLYGKMAETYWDTYARTADITNSCGAAIQYAVDHPEILAPLGSEYHGLSSIKYKPEDICPFRTQ